MCVENKIKFKDMRNIDLNTMHEYISSIKAVREQIDIVSNVKDEFDCVYSSDGLRLIQMNNHKIKSYTVREGVTTICDNAFKDCKHLKTIELPNSLATIGHSAFANCKMLRDVKLPDSLQQIASSAFAHCTSMKEIELPKSVKVLGYKVFAQCTSLRSVDIKSQLIFVPCCFVQKKVVTIHLS